VLSSSSSWHLKFSTSSSAGLSWAPVGGCCGARCWSARGGGGGGGGGGSAAVRTVEPPRQSCQCEKGQGGCTSRTPHPWQAITHHRISSCGRWLQGHNWRARHAGGRVARWRHDLATAPTHPRAPRPALLELLAAWTWPWSSVGACLTSLEALAVASCMPARCPAASSVALTLRGGACMRRDAQACAALGPRHTTTRAAGPSPCSCARRATRMCSSWPGLRAQGCLLPHLACPPSSWLQQPPRRRLPAAQTEEQQRQQ